MDDLTRFKRKKEGFLGQQMIVLPPNSLEIIKNNLLINNFYFTAIGYYPNAEFHDRLRTEGSDEYIMLYCTEGEGRVSINDKLHLLKPNTYLIIPPYVSHHYKSSIENPWTLYWVHFTGSRAKVIYNRFSLEQEPTVRFIPYNENSVKSFLDVIKLLQISFDERTLEISNINITHFVCSFVYHQQIQQNASENNMVNNSIEYMKLNLNKTLKIQDLAFKENLSVSRYSEIFKASTGQPPIHYFINLKIQKSCQLLYFTDRSVKEIAVEFGFSDQYYFSRVFKKFMGTPPSKYRKKYKQ